MIVSMCSPREQPSRFHCFGLGVLTVKVGFSMTEVELVSSTEADGDSTASSVSSARTWPRRAAEE